VVSPAGTFGYRYTGAAQGVWPASLVSAVTLPGGAYITNSYDSVARLRATKLLNSAAATLNSHAYGYNLAGQRLWLTNTLGDYRAYGYDNAGQLTNATGHEAGGAVRLNESQAFCYDPAGNLTQRVNNVYNQYYRVNKLNELTNVARAGTLTVAGFTTTPATSVSVAGVAATLYGDNTYARPGYPAAGFDGLIDIRAVAYSSSGAFSSTIAMVNLASSINYTNDQNGNLVGALSGEQRTYDYDDENQLIRVTAVRSGSNLWKTEFAYDGKMRRRIRREYTWNGAWSQTDEVHYIYDGNLVIQERSSPGPQTVTYTRGRDLSGTLEGAGGIGGLLARTDRGLLASGDVDGHAYYHADGNGNVT